MESLLVNRLAFAHRTWEVELGFKRISHSRRHRASFWQGTEKSPGDLTLKGQWGFGHRTYIGLKQVLGEPKTDLFSRTEGAADPQRKKWTLITGSVRRLQHGHGVNSGLLWGQGHECNSPGRGSRLAEVLWKEIAIYQAKAKLQGGTQPHPSSRKFS